MPFALFLSALPALCGAAGFFLRRWQLATAFEPTGLPLPGAPATLALAGLSIALLVLFALLLWRQFHGKADLSCDEAFRCESPVYMTAMVVASLLMTTGGVLELMRYVNHETSALATPILAALLVASGGAVLLLGKEHYRALGNSRFSGISLLPAFTWCLWLVLVYQTSAGDPVLQNYVYRMLAIIAALLGHYFLSSCSFERVRPTLTVWSGGAAVYFAAVALADEGSLSATVFLFSASIIYFTAQNAALLRNFTAVREENTHE